MAWCGMPGRPRSQSEYVAIAHRMADTGCFVGPESIRYVLLQWSRETEVWWSHDLEAQLKQRTAAVAPTRTYRDIRPA